MRQFDKYNKSYFPGDICQGFDCGNKAHPSTGFCTDCVPIPGNESLLKRLILWPLRVLYIILMGE